MSDLYTGSWYGTVVVMTPDELGSAPLASIAEATQSLRQIEKLADELTECLSEMNHKMREAKTWDEMLLVVDSHAGELDPIVDRYSFQASHLVSLIREIDQEAQQRIVKIKETSPELRGDDASKIARALRHLAQSMLRFLNMAHLTSERLNGIMGRSSRLDQPLRRLQSATADLAGMRGIFGNWLKELRELGL